MLGFRPHFCRLGPGFRSAVRFHKNIAYKAGKSAFSASIMRPKPRFVKSRLSISIHFGKEWIKMANSGITQQRAGALRLQLSALVLVNAFVQGSVQRHNAQDLDGDHDMPQVVGIHGDDRCRTGHRAAPGQ